MPQYQGVWNLAQQAQALTSQRWVTDPVFDYTTLLLQADNAANGAQNNTFLDSSNNNFTITRNGGNPGMTQGSFSPFSATGWSNYFGGSDYLSAASNAAFQLGTGDFTVEYFVFPISFSNSPSMVDTRVLSTGNGYSDYFNTSGKFLLFWNNANQYTSTATFVTNTWYHIAVCRASGTVSVYINGNRDGTFSSSTNLSDSNLRIANNQGASNGLTGYLSSVRIVKGTAVYSGSTITVPTSALTNITNTSLLTCQSNRFVDNSSNAFALTVTGTPSVQAFSPFAPQYQYTPTVTGGSGYFDGTGDYLTVADNAAFDLGSGDFLIEAWAYSTSSTNFKMVIGQWNASGNLSYTLRQNANKWAFSYTTGGTTETAVNGTSTQQLNAWAHLAVIRTGNTLGLFVNGVRETTASMTGITIFNNTGNFSVGGAGNGGDLWVGNVGPCRVIKGTLPSGYDATQTTLAVPTTPFTSTASTSILCNFTNAGILDGTMKNNLETVGNAQVSTNVVKYGSGSMSFDGTDDRVSIPSSPNLDFGSGDFTIECWAYNTAWDTDQNQLFERGRFTVGKSYRGWMKATQIVFEVNLSATATGTYTTITATIANNLNQWYHVAFVRQGSVFTIYRDGVALATTTSTAAVFTTTEALSVGGAADGNNNIMMIGYIDDFRITKGIARYTRNFTPPQVALPRQ